MKKESIQKSARFCAFKILWEWEQNGGFLKDIHPSLSKDLSREDKSFSYELVLGTFRNSRLLDYNIKAYTKGSVHKKIRVILRLAFYQMEFLPNVPHHSLKQFVEIAKKLKGQWGGNFCNGVIRSFQKGAFRYPEQGEENALSIRYSHPDWLVDKWSETHLPDMLEKRLSTQISEPSQWVRINKAKCRYDDLSDDVKKNLDKSLFDGNYYQLSGSIAQILNSKDFDLGYISIQDPAAYLIFQLMDLNKGETVLDTCSAPGGKTALMLEQMNGDINVISGDLNFFRLNKIKDLSQRIGVGQVNPIVFDGLELPFKKPFDKILLDVPCSNMGVLARRPEAKWNITLESLQEHSKLQEKLLEGALSLIKDKGAVVYATCSPEPEETYAVLKRALDRHDDYVLDDACKYVDKTYVKDQCVCIIPGQSELDGFFGARIIKK